MANGELAMRAEFEIEQHGGIYGLSKATGVNPGVIWRVKNGGNSPTLRRLWKVPKHPPRPRLIINCPYETISRFHRARGDMTTGEYLEVLLDAADGIGELP